MHFLISAQLTPEAFARCDGDPESELLRRFAEVGAELGVEVDGVLVNSAPLPEARPEVQVLAMDAGLF